MEDEARVTLGGIDGVSEADGFRSFDLDVSGMPLGHDHFAVEDGHASVIEIANEKRPADWGRPPQGDLGSPAEDSGDHAAHVAPVSRIGRAEEPFLDKDLLLAQWLPPGSAYASGGSAWEEALN
jgi:hypothetical protein